MRKSILAVIFSLFALAELSAQDYHIGIRVAPNYSLTRAFTSGSATTIEGDGGALGFLLGAFVDYNFRQNYFFHTGINYTTQSTRIVASDPSVGGGAFNEAYRHEFLQIPLLLKLYTNEVSLDTKLYFNFGIIPEIKLGTKQEEVSAVVIENFNSFDLAGNLGLGIEKQIGTHTRIFSGFNFNLGFFNQVDEQNENFDPITIKSRMLSLEVGMKF